jgi:RNA polymerase-binding transcription factor DksA
VTAQERRQIEARLDARLRELEHTRAQLRRSGDGMRDSELSWIDNHPGDAGTALHDFEVDETTELVLVEEERRIADARRALADGTYGFCRECRRPISPERLKAVPEAVLCIDCQRHLESSYRQRHL